MASGSITSWQIDGETVETVADFIFLGSKITADGDSSHEIILRNLYAAQKATVRTGHGTTDWFQIGKGVCQGCILSPFLFNLYGRVHQAKCWTLKHKLESKIAMRNQ